VIRYGEKVRKLHEVSRIAEEALHRARQLKVAGESAVPSELNRLDGLEQDGCFPPNVSIG
jgi:hypothetical protein